MSKLVLLLKNGFCNNSTYVNEDKLTLAMNSNYEVPPSSLSTPVYPPQQVPALIVSGKIDMPRYCCCPTIWGDVYAGNNGPSTLS